MCGSILSVSSHLVWYALRLGKHVHGGGAGERERERGLMGNDGKMLSLTTLTTKTAVARC